jgi:hypothetical protein
MDFRDRIAIDPEIRFGGAGGAHLRVARRRFSSPDMKLICRLGLETVRSL